jgi:hypothetical protein
VDDDEDFESGHLAKPNGVGNAALRGEAAPSDPRLRYKDVGNLYLKKLSNVRGFW